MQVPDGAILTWVGSWTPNYSEWLAGNSAQDVSNTLGQNGFSVRSLNVESSGIIGQIVGLGPAPITVSMVLETNSGATYDSEQTVQQLIESSIMQATGKAPISSAITKIQLPAGSPVGTPSPGTQVSAASTCQGGIGGFFSSLFGSCQKAQSQATVADSGGFSLSSLTSKGTLYIALAIFGFVAALALIGYSGALQVRRINVT